MKPNSAVTYIKEKQESLSTGVIPAGEYYLYKSIPFRINEPFVRPIDIGAVLSALENSFPFSYFKGLKSIEIGYHPVFSLKNVNAAFLDDRFYVTNNQNDESDLLDDIVHELAHLLEKKFQDLIYSDKAIAEEFLMKRNALRRMLKTFGCDVERQNFMSLKYSKEFDDFLEAEVGDEKLKTIIDGLYLSPYSIRSVNEYFAIGFEFYYLVKPALVRQVCPRLFEKIVSLQNMEN